MKMLLILLLCIGNLEGTTGFVPRPLIDATPGVLTKPRVKPRIFTVGPNPTAPSDEESNPEPSLGSPPNLSLEGLFKGPRQESLAQGPLRVLFLSSDTGGGHRASAESLATQFLNQYPGTTYDIVDVWTQVGCLPYRKLVDSYKHLSQHPRQWKTFYHLTNSRPSVLMTDLHSSSICGTKIANLLRSYDPDVVVSVHPAMNHGPRREVQSLGNELGKHIPFFTVVTDYGTAHKTWFNPDVEKIYIASEAIHKLTTKNRIPDRKTMQLGLPIRQDFEDEARALGDRTTEAGKAYQRELRQKLGLDPSAKARIVLVMGGGEGVGDFDGIVKGLYTTFSNRGIDATIAVVCGRNEKLFKDFQTRDWKGLLLESGEQKQSPAAATGEVKIVPLGFVSNMAQYMAASDVLVTKAGPGTIAEAAAVGLPCMLTSFLPGQEAGNLDIVLDGGFGAFQREPESIAVTVSSWLEDEAILSELSRNAAKEGHPHAAANIVADIGKTTHWWMDMNQSS